MRAGNKKNMGAAPAPDGIYPENINGSACLWHCVFLVSTAANIGGTLVYEEPD